MRVIEFLKVDHVVRCPVSTCWVSAVIPMGITNVGMPKPVPLRKCNLYGSVWVSMRNVIGWPCFAYKGAQSVCFKVKNKILNEVLLFLA